MKQNYNVMRAIYTTACHPVSRLRRKNTMKNKYPHIFEPITVRRMTVKNRIVMTPMGTNYGEQNGEMSFLHINYYEQRAKGGTGLIIVENASVDSPQVQTELHSFVLIWTTTSQDFSSSARVFTSMVHVSQYS